MGGNIIWGMDRTILKNYKAFIIGGIIALGLALMFIGMEGFYIVNPEFVSQPIYILINIAAFVCCWGILSFLTNKFPIYKTVGVLSLLVAAMLAERYLNIRENPITIPLIILFWLGVASLILPQFFKKYQIAILSVYGFVIAYYFFVFGQAPQSIENHRENFANFILIPIPVFAALWGYEQWRWLRMLQVDKAKAELAMLKNQINPHFFFNTLNNLYGLTVEKSDEAPAMILKLSDMMRYAIYEGRADFVALADEVAYLEDYIELHKIRYQKNVDISLRKDLVHAHKIAPLLLVVPLENAFKHGVESLATDAFVELEINTKPSSILFRISNNYEPKGQDGEGIGLTNLRKRLALIYPDQHKLEIKQTSDTYSLSLEIEIACRH